MTVIDTNTNSIDPIDTLRAKGVTAVGRYYRVVHRDWQLTKAKAQKLSGAQIELFTVYEDTGHNLTLTAAQGKIGKDRWSQRTRASNRGRSAGDWGTPGSVHTFVDNDHVQRATIGREARLFAGDWYPAASYNPYDDLR